MTAYYLATTGEDLTETTEVDKGFGKETLSKAQLMMAWYVGQAYDIPVLVRAGEIVGFGISLCVFNCVLHVRHCYVDPGLRKSGYMKALYEAVAAGRDIKRVYFQTVKSRPPEDLFGHTATRRTVVREDGDLVTWEMKWE